MSAKLKPQIAYTPRWLRAGGAALHLAMSLSKFRELVDSGHLPAPVDFHGVKLWDRAELDATVEAVKDHIDGPKDHIDGPDEGNSFDRVIELARSRRRSK